jgi:tRNA(fMet)-specific endonuclease VapC
VAGSILLDTSVIIDVFANNSAAIRLLSGADQVFLPAIALGELFYGAEGSKRPEEGRAQVREFAAANAVLSCDEATAQFYGQIKNGLRAKGRPLPENDIWIAAVARQHGLTLVTRDAHFREIDDLALLAW